MGGSPPAGQGAVYRGGRVLWRVTFQVSNLCSFSCSGTTQGLVLLVAEKSWMVQPSSTAHRTRIRERHHFSKRVFPNTEVHRRAEANPDRSRKH